MPAELAVVLLGLLAQLPKLLRIVENMGESFLALARFQGLGRWPVQQVREALLLVFVRLAGPIPGLAGFVERVSKALPLPLIRRLAPSSRSAGLVERMREALFLPGHRLAPQLSFRRLRRVGLVLTDPIAQLLDGEPRAGSTERHGVEVGAVPVLAGQDGLAGSGQHLCRLAPLRPCVETGNGYAPLFGLTLEGFVHLDEPLRRFQIALGGVSRHGLVLVVIEEPVEHVTSGLGQVGMLSERVHTLDQHPVSVHQEQRQVRFTGTRDQIVPVALEGGVEGAPVQRGIRLRGC